MRDGYRVGERGRVSGRKVKRPEKQPLPPPTASTGGVADELACSGQWPDVSASFHTIERFVSHISCIHMRFVPHISCMHMCFVSHIRCMHMPQHHSTIQRYLLFQLQKPTHSSGCGVYHTLSLRKKKHACSGALCARNGCGASVSGGRWWRQQQQRPPPAHGAATRISKPY
jgi:hypothetical protein